MTTPIPHREDPIPDSWKNESLRYLMGELSPSQAAEFETKLEQQPDLAEVLASQAEMITVLADTAIESNSRSTTPRAEDQRSIATVAAMLALAVCLAGLVIGIWPNPNEEVAATNTTDLVAKATETDSTEEDANVTDLDSEALLIARAWAEDRVAESRDEAIVAEEEVIAGEDINESLAEFTTADDDDEMDSTLSWMYIAVSSNPEEANDG